MINILIDGNYIFHKTFGVFGGFGAKDPSKVLGTPGEQAMFIRKVATDLCAGLRLLPQGGRLVFTCDSRSWRKDVEIEDGGYKSNRIKDETVDWSIFFDLMSEFGHQLENQGFVFSKVKGAEGDDLLYFWSEHFNSIGENCIIISGDKDMHQLARHNEKGWTIIWNNNSKNNILAVPPGWEDNWVNKEESVSIFDMTAAISPDKEKIKEFLKKVQVEEIVRRDFVFNKMLTGDKGDAVPGVWYVQTPNGKFNGISPKKAEQIMESLNQSEWKGTTFTEMLKSDEFLSWVSGFILRVLKDVDNTDNRKKVSSNLLRNYTLMWLDRKVMPAFVSESCDAEVLRGIEIPKRNVTIDRVKILEGTAWATTQSVPKAFDPFANF
jgi:5'-3' exonuclease